MCDAALVDEPAPADEVIAALVTLLIREGLVTSAQVMGETADLSTAAQHIANCGIISAAAGGRAGEIRDRRAGLRLVGPDGGNDAT